MAIDQIRSGGAKQLLTTGQSALTLRSRSGQTAGTHGAAGTGPVTGSNQTAGLSNGGLSAGARNGARSAGVLAAAANDGVEKGD